MSVAEHDHDFFLWARQQTDALRRLAETRPNVGIDWSNVIEEIEDLGREQVHAVRSHFRVLLIHLLALTFSPDENSRRHWREEIFEQRARLSDRLSDNPSLKPRLPELLESAYRQARKQASDKLGLAVSTLPATCPFTLDEVQDDDWFPEALEGSVG